MELTFDDDQVALLREVLETTLRDLSYEIADTDTASYKRTLRDRREAIEAIAAKLGAAAPY